LDKSYGLEVDTIGGALSRTRVSASGYGSVSPSGSVPIIGSRTFTAFPNKHYKVDQWTVGGVVVQEGGASYTMSSAMLPKPLVVSFKLGPLAEDGIESVVDNTTPLATAPTSFLMTGKSKYSGFLTSTDGSQTLGYFKSIKVSKTGKLSAKMYFGNTSYSIKGLFDQNGRYSGLATSSSGSDVTVTLQLVRTSADGYKIEGSVAVGELIAKVFAVKSGATGAQAGNYTLLILAESVASMGHGYATMKVTSVGAAKIKGLLGDGSKWTAKCYLTPDGEMPMYAPLYRKTGSLSAVIRFRNVAGISDCDGELTWHRPSSKKIYPNGFDLKRNLIGSRFSYSGARLIVSIPNGAPNIEVHVGEGSGNGVRSWDLEWTTTNKLYNAAPEKVKLTVKTKSGQIKGKIPDGGVIWKAGGVVFQKQNLAAGLAYVKDGLPRSLVIVPKESQPE